MCMHSVVNSRRLHLVARRWAFACFPTTRFSSYAMGSHRFCSDGAMLYAKRTMCVGVGSRAPLSVVVCRGCIASVSSSYVAVFVFAVFVCVTCRHRVTYRVPLPCRVTSLFVDITPPHVCSVCVVRICSLSALICGRLSSSSLSLNDVVISKDIPDCN
jgi:hypothetical protein